MTRRSPDSDPPVIRLTRQDVAAAKNFLRDHYGAEFYGAEDRYFSWLYLDQPCAWFEAERADGRIPINVIRDDAGAIEAIHCFAPFDAHTPWGGGIGIWDVDWISASKVPGQGRLLAQTLLDGVDLYAGYGCNELSERAFGRMGMTLVSEIPRRVAILDPQGLEEGLRAAGLDAIPRLRDTAATIGGDWHALDAAGVIPDGILDAYRGGTPFGVSRGRRWLTWRYDRHPFIEYRIIAADADGAQGVAVLRIERSSDRLAVCRICDFFAIAGHDSGLLKAVLTCARDHGCVLVDYFSTDGNHAARLDAAADELAIELLDTPRIPFMFQPAAWSGRNSINLVIAAGGRAPTGVKLAAFHATKADANQDILRRQDTAARLGPKRT